VIKHRHAVGGGYARGEETRERIVDAALTMFGERGFEGASTRDIATVGGVKASALPYYFDNKETKAAGKKAGRGCHGCRGDDV
jgi:AcrR family transcriptional regulator